MGVGNILVVMLETRAVPASGVQASLTYSRYTSWYESAKLSVQQEDKSHLGRKDDKKAFRRHSYQLEMTGDKIFID